MSGGCPTGCGRNVSAGKLMCGSCWGKVPRDLQQKVYATWRTYRAAPAFPNNVTERTAYREARDNAIASIA